jgi:hypothetical protein
VDSLGNTFLHKVVLMARQGQADSENTLRIVKALMDAGVNPSHRNNKGRLAEEEVLSTDKALKRVTAALQDYRLRAQMQIESDKKAKAQQKKEKERLRKRQVKEQKRQRQLEEQQAGGGTSGQDGGEAFKDDDDDDDDQDLGSTLDPVAVWLSEFEDKVEDLEQLLEEQNLMSEPSQDAPQPPALLQPNQRALEAKEGSKPGESAPGAKNSFELERHRRGHKAAETPTRMPGREAAREALIQQAQLVDEQNLVDGQRQVVHRRNYANDAFVPVVEAGEGHLLCCASDIPS